LSKIRAVGLRIDVVPAFRAHAVIGCDTDDACREIATSLDGLRRAAREHAPRRAPVAIAIERIRVEAVQREVRLKLELTNEEATNVVGSIFEFLEGEAVPRAAVSPLPSASADEVLRPLTPPSAAPRTLPGEAASSHRGSPAPRPPE
jgi:hypothetical protein